MIMSAIRIGILVALLVCLSPCGSAAPPSIGVGPPAGQPAPVPNAGARRSYWLGRAFVFLTLSPGEQPMGYRGLSLERDSGAAPDPSWETDTGALRYDRFVGRVMTLIAVKDRGDGTFDVTFQLNAHGPLVYGHKFSCETNTPNIEPVETLGRARKQWIGKTIWAIQTSLSTYDAARQTEDTFPVLFAEPLKIVNVYRGRGIDEGLWVVVKEASGQEGYYKVRASFDFADKTAPYHLDEDCAGIFSLQNPALAGYTQRIIDDINGGVIDIGMTRDQVLYAFGDPDDTEIDHATDGDHELWIYPDWDVYLVNGKVTAVQSADYADDNTDMSPGD